MPSIQQKHAARLLHNAVAAGNIGWVAALLRDGADPNIDVQDSDYPLAIAAHLGRLDMVRLLLAHGAEVGARSQLGFTALQMTCAGGNLSIVQELLTAGANINERCGDGNTALGLMALKGDVETLNMLICAGSSLDVRDNDGYAAIHQAASLGHVSALEKLVLAGSSHAWRTNRLYTPLAEACCGGHSACVNYLLNTCGADPGVVDAGGVLLLGVAVDGGNKAVVESLMRFDECQLGPNAYSDALRRAVFNGADSILNVLLSADGRTHVNSCLRETQICLLHVSTGCCNPIAMSMLLKAGADENAVGPNGQVPLDVIDIFNHPTNIAQFIAKGLTPFSQEPIAQRREGLMLKQAPAYRARSWRWPDASPACALSLTTAPATNPAEPAPGKTRETAKKGQVEPTEMSSEDLEDACDIMMAAMTTNAMLQKLGWRVFRRPPITLGGSKMDGHPMVVSSLIRYARKL